MKKSRGFTLLEMLVVIIIIVLLASVAVVMMNVFMRGQGVRQGALVVTTAFAQCKQLAADQRVVHFLVFTNAPDGGKIGVYKDANMNKQFDGAAVDPEIPQKQSDLPKFVDFATMPAWVGIEPSGYCLFSPGFTDLSAGAFEGQNAAGTAVGDIIVKMQGKPYRMCMDIDRASGKIRKAHFYAQ